MRAKIYILRGIKVILERDLAILFDEEEHVLRKAIIENPESFPKDFAFKLTISEWDRLSSHRHAPDSLEEPEINVPYAFTEYGIVMAANFLRTSNARKLCVDVARIFIAVSEDVPVTDVMSLAMQRMRNDLAGMIKYDVKSQQLYEVINIMLEHKYESRHE